MVGAGGGRYVGHEENFKSDGGGGGGGGGGRRAEGRGING